MIFQLLPTTDTMLELYQKPRSIERFNEYLQLLQGDTKNDLAFPIMGFNPMAKEHVVKKLLELKELGAEKIIQETIDELNATSPNNSVKNIFKVSLNLQDDLKGGWTNRYTSDYANKFKLNAIVNRKFCTPVFWTSENYTPSLIKERTLQCCYRAIHWLSAPKPQTLKEHIDQETFVEKHSGSESYNTEEINFKALNAFYNQHQESDDYSIIFNFLYGDDATKSLEFPTYGVQGIFPGYVYAKALARKNLNKNNY